MGDFFMKKLFNSKRGFLNILIAFGICVLTALVLEGLFKPLSVAREKENQPIPTEETVTDNINHIPAVNLTINSISKHNRDSFTEGLLFDDTERLFETGGRYKESKLFYYSRNPDFDYVDGFWGNFIKNANDSNSKDEAENEGENNEKNEVVFEIKETLPKTENELVHEYELEKNSVAYFPDQYFVEGSTC